VRRSISASFKRLSLARLFWNQILTWVSLRLRDVENSALSAMLRYCFSRYFFSSVSSCSDVKGVRGFRLALCLRRMGFAMSFGIICIPVWLVGICRYGCADSHGCVGVLGTPIDLYRDFAASDGGGLRECSESWLTKDSSPLLALPDDDGRESLVSILQTSLLSTLLPRMKSILNDNVGLAAGARRCSLTIMVLFGV